MRDIQFKQFSVQNFLSIGNQPVELNFTPGLHLITGINRDKDGRKNGVGKSTVMDAIHWVLFGTPVRDINKDKIANFRSKGACTGTITFEVTLNGKKVTYTVTRKLSPSKLELLADGEDKTLSTVVKTTELIENILGFNSTLFRNSIALSINNTKAFLAQDKIEKRKFIEGVFNLSVFSDILADVRKKSIETKNQIEVATAKVDAKRQNIDLYTKQRDAFETDKQQRIADAQAVLEKAEAEVVTKKSELKDLTVFVEKQKNLRAKKVEIETQIKQITEVSKAFRDQLGNTKTAINTTQFERKTYANGVKEKAAIQKESLQREKKNYIQSAKDEVVRREKELRKQKEETLGNIKRHVEQAKADITQRKAEYIKSCEASICPTCKRPHKEKIEPDPAKLKEFDDMLKTCHNQSFEDKLLEFDRLIAECKVPDTSAKEAEFDKQILALENVQPDPAELAKFETRLQELTNKLPEIEKEIGDRETAIETLRTQGISKIEQALEKIQAVIAANESVKAQVDILTKQALGAKTRVDEAKNQKNQFVDMLSNAEKEFVVLNDELNLLKKAYAIYESAKYIVSEEGVKTFIIKKMLFVLNERIDYYLKKLDANSTVTFNEFFEETIKNDQGIECSYYNFSGAEMKSIDLACLFAFMDIRRMQGDVAINISMYDELFDSSFDEKGLDHVAAILGERVTANGESVFVISHRKEALKHATGEVILLEKHNGITKRITNG